MKHWMKLVVTLAGFAAMTAGALPEQNLVPNFDFTAKPDPLKGWRYVYPHQQQQYGKNQEYIKVVDYNGKHCVEFTVPKAVAENQGAMIETAFIKCEAGATYKAEVDCNAGDLTMIVFIESWIPMPDELKAAPKLRIWPAEDGRPRLHMASRKQCPRFGGGSWRTVSETYTVPKSVDLNVNGKLTPTPPEYISLKAYVYGAGKPVFHARVTNFRLTKVAGESATPLKDLRSKTK